MNKYNLEFRGVILMMYNAKELKLNIQNMEFDYITFGNGTKPLVMIQGLNTRGIKGAALSLAYMYRIFVKDYKVYLFDRRPIVREGITVRDMASDIAKAMDRLGITNADVFGVLQGGIYLVREGESVEEAKMRLAKEQEERDEQAKEYKNIYVEIPDSKETVKKNLEASFGCSKCIVCRYWWKLNLRNRDVFYNAGIVIWGTDNALGNSLADCRYSCDVHGVSGTIVGVVGILLLLFLIPMCLGLKDSKKTESIEAN